MKGVTIAVWGVLTLLACSTPASALSVRITSEGFVSGGYDATGVFGAAGSDLTGQAYSFVALFDLSQAAYSAFGGVRTDIYGGGAFSSLPSQPPSLGGAVLTINGHGYALQGNWVTLLMASDNGVFNFDTQYVQDIVDDGVHYVNSAVLLNEAPSFGLFTLATYVPPSGNLCAAADCSASNFAIVERVNGSDVSAAFGGLAPASVRITAVPEPASWCLMILGFGLSGAMLRRRQMEIA